MSEYDVLINKYDALNNDYDQLYPKPMKHANTHASGGTDPITPGDIGAYSKNEVDTLLSNNDPRNWGLGGNSKDVTDWNNEKTNGWVRDAKGTEDKHSPFIGVSSIGLISDYKSGGDAFQLAFGRNQYEKTRTYIKFRAYNADDKVWGEWEWVNPPMALGVEYRTTERFLGKPVYVKVIQAGFNPAGMNKLTEDKTVSASGLVRFSAVSGGWQFPSLMFGGNYDDNGNIQVVVQTDSAGIHVTTLSKTRDMTSVTVNVSVYYTKD